MNGAQRLALNRRLFHAAAPFFVRRARSHHAPLLRGSKHLSSHGRRRCAAAARCKWLRRPHGRPRSGSRRRSSPCRRKAAAAEEEGEGERRRESCCCSPFRRHLHLVGPLRCFARHLGTSPVERKCLDVRERGGGKGSVSVEGRERGKRRATAERRRQNQKKWRRRHRSFFGKIAPDSTSKLHSRRVHGRHLGESAPVSVSWSESTKGEGGK